MNGRNIVWNAGIATRAERFAAVRQAGATVCGEITAFTGVSDPYEPPERPEVHLRTTDIELAIAEMLRALEPLAAAA